MLRHRRNWTSMEEMIHVLSQYDIYVVLTGDELLEKEFVGLGPHHDIDILTVNQKRTAELIEADRYDYYYGEHYRVCIAGKKLTIGIFELGDDYMDARWQKEMLQNRVLHPRGHYVMDAENHFYWILYHVLCQKRVIPEHYRRRILKEADMLGIVAGADTEMWHILEEFLLEKGYSCPYPVKLMERIHTNGFRTMRPEGYERWKIKRARNLPIRVIRYIYRHYLRKKYG